MSDFKDTRKEIKRVTQVAEKEVDEQNVLSAFFARHPEIRDLESNRRICLDYFGGDPLTSEALEECLTHPRFRQMLCVFENEKEERSALEERIVSLLEGGTSKENILAAKQTFRYKSMAELRNRAQTLEQQVKFRSMSTAELREVIKRPEPGFHELPAMYRNKSMLLTLPPGELRHFIKKYGSEAINKALNSKE